MTKTLRQLWNTGGAALAARLFLLMLAYYLLKPVREGLILSNGSAELRSYAVAIQAGLLILLMPLYGLLFRHFTGEKLYTRISVFFIANLMLFYFAGLKGWPIGIVFFVWLGVFSVMQVAQFWGLAADVNSVASGQKLFAYIAMGGSLGAVVGSWAGKEFARFGPYTMMLLASVVLALALVIGHHRLTNCSPPHKPAEESPMRKLLGGIDLVMHDPYLRLAALFVLLLNCINSLGEFILAKVVMQEMAAHLAPGLSKSAAISGFYAGFFLWVNVISLTIQVFMVSRLYKRIGVHGALLIPPLLALCSFALISLIPTLMVVRWIKIAENSIDYSLQNTNRHTLFLPLDAAGKYEGKTAIDTVFWRLGDLLQAGLVFVGASLFAFGIVEFAWLGAALAVAWLYVAVIIGGNYSISAMSPRDDRLSYDPQELADLANEHIRHAGDHDLDKLDDLNFKRR